MTLKKYFFPKRLFWCLFCVILFSLTTVWRRTPEIIIINHHDSSQKNDKISYAIKKDNVLVSSNVSYVTKPIYKVQDGKSLHTKDVKQVKNEGKMFLFNATHETLYYIKLTYFIRHTIQLCYIKNNCFFT